MPTVTASASLAVGAVALLASVVFLGVMARHREEPTARPLLALAVALVVGAGAHLVLVEFAPVRSLFGSGVWSTGFADGLWLLLAYDLGAVVALTWFLFALGYTGRGGFETPVATGAVGALLLALVGANAGFAGLAGPLGVGARPLNVAVGVVLVLATALALIGAFLVLTVAARHRVFPAGQTAAVLGGVGVVLAGPFAATTADAPATTPLGITAASVCFSVAVVRYRLFETLPVATVVGRDRVGDEIAEGVLVVDAERRLRDLNPAAETLFDIEPTAAVGDSLERVAPGLPDPETLVDGDPVDVRVGSGDESSRVASVAADPVTDAQGRRVGYLLVCRDVTARRARAQRLGVLTQLVAGVTRDRMRAVADAADEAVAAESSPDESPGEGPSGDRSPGEEPPTVESAADRAWETSTRLAALVARVRDVDRALADRGDASTDPERAAGADADGEAASGGPVREEARTDAGRAEGVDLAAAVSDDTELLVVNSPSNPTGAVFSETALEGVRDLAVEHDVAVISDEIYQRITYDADHISLASLDGMADRTITVNGFSKAYSMTGWRLGYVHATDGFVGQAGKLHSHSVSCAVNFVQRAGVEALENTDESVEEMRRAFADRRDLLVDLFDEHGVDVDVGDGAFYMMIPVDDDDQAWCEAAIEEAAVACVPGSAFNAPGYARISYAASEERLREAVDRLVSNDLL